MCTRCRGTGEIVNAKGQADACPNCARRAEAAWCGRNIAPLPDAEHCSTIFQQPPSELVGKINMHREVSR